MEKITKTTIKVKPKIKVKNKIKIKNTKAVPPKKGPRADGIELRGGAKTNQNNAKRTRRIAQVSKQKSLSGKEKTKAIKKAIYGGVSPKRKIGTSRPEIGLAFKQQALAKKAKFKNKKGR